MPQVNPFIGGVHVSSYGGTSAAPQGASPTAGVAPTPVVPGGGGPSYAVPMVTILIVALIILIVARLAGIRLLTTVSARVGR